MLLLPPKAPRRGYVVVLSTSDELIYLRVGGLDYIYCMDRAHHKHFFKLMKYTPGKALKFIKETASWYELEKKEN